MYYDVFWSLICIVNCQSGQREGSKIVTFLRTFFLHDPILVVHGCFFLWYNFISGITWHLEKSLLYWKIYILCILNASYYPIFYLQDYDWPRYNILPYFDICIFLPDTISANSFGWNIKMHISATNCTCNTNRFNRDWSDLMKSIVHNKLQCGKWNEKQFP